ncbi:hypothetical protein BD626DRAFT_624471 [Schizophyllum amplum]|uniref:Uncharacterized protein n=1 Tax=Schizophyllum amplum TaxID=97359 RepID=A0A550CW72_9AGAR|nr:hypothetical protein BD626DRAFT_624471 [Auriculariopsis ampla]
MSSSHPRPSTPKVSRAFTKREPLRDMVQRPGQEPVEEQSSPTKKRRAARAPAAQLAQRIKARHAVPSSLPPSSPPRPSSSSQEHQRHGHEDDEPSIDIDAELRKDFSSGDPDVDPEDIDRPAENSDPFGFFAVEKQLKDERNAGRAARPHPLAPRRVQVRPTPARREPPPRTRRRHVLPADSSFMEDDSVDTPAVFSSPSPIKRGKRPVPAQDDSEDDADAAAAILTEDVVQSDDEAHDSSHDKRVVAENEEEENESPVRPRKTRVSRTRAVTKGVRRSTRKRVKEDADEADDDDKPPKKRTAQRTISKKASGAKKPATRTRSARTKAKEPESDGEDFGLDEGKQKQEDERKARVAYWKKMADYTMEEENVYIV